MDSGYAAGTTVTPSTTRCWPSSARTARPATRRSPGRGSAVADFVVTGPKSNLPFHAELLGNAEFVSGDYDTGLVSRMRQA